MSDEAALLNAIVAHVDEDTPRLVYADWLDEHGDPDRAAFIRVQCRLADMMPHDPDWCELTGTEAELEHRLQKRVAWFSPPGLGDLGYVKMYRRGFPFDVDCVPQSGGWTDQETTRLTDGLAHALATTTIRGIRLLGIPPGQFAKMVAHPWFGELHRLTFDFHHWEREHRVEAVRRLATPDASRNLRQLSVQIGIGPELVDCFLAPDAFPNLRQLWLPYLHVAPPDVHRLLTAAWVRNLGELNLSLSNSARAEQLLTGAGALPELHTLKLIAAPLTIADHLAPGSFPRLVSLACPNARIKLRGLQRLFDAPWFARLRVLDLTSNELGDRGLVALAAHPVARTLRVLRVGNNPFGRAALTALTRPGAFPELTWLDLSLANRNKRKVTEADLTRFLAHLALPRLRRLSLNYLPLGDSGAEAIAANPALGELRELYLGDGIMDHGMRALRAAEHLQHTRLVVP